LFFSGLLVLLIAASLPTSLVKAQCGSQASSCKNCHEVQGEMPVNNDGTGWHESHAFGDFCYICHAGNQQAADEESAHAGMVPPLSDVKASCQMCHATDLDERAKVYADLLGVDLTSSGSSANTAATTSGSGSGDSQASAPAPAVVAGSQSDDCSNLELVVDDANMVDYVQRYDEIVLGQKPVNWGDVALLGLIALIVVGGGGFVLVNEISLRTAIGETKKAEGEYPVDVNEMLPALAGLKSSTRKSLKKILGNPQKTDKVLGLIDSVMGDENNEEHD
jgi:cytochrome c553